MTPRPSSGSVHRPAPAPAPAGTAGPASVDILIVDDNPQNLIALEAILRSPQYTLIRAESGRQALKELLDREFALILLDVKMPEMDGFETAELIRTREQSRHTPIIFLTAIDQIPGSESRGYAVGAVDFLFKPFNPDVLRSKVTAFVDLYVKGRELQAKAEEMRRREAEEHRRRLEEVQTQRDRFFSLSSDMMAVLDRDGIIREANLAWEKTLGISAGELKDSPVLDLFQSQDRPQILGALRGLREGRGFLTFEASHRSKAGALRWLSWTLISFPNEQGGYVVARDVTERVRVGRQLEDFFENAPVGSHWIGPDGVLLRANRAEIDLLGYAPEEYVGRSIREFHADPATADRLLERLRAGETIKDYPARLRCKDGSTREVLLDANALIEEGRFIHSRAFLRDVTAQLQAERRQAVGYGVTRILAESSDISGALPQLLEVIGAGFEWTLGTAWRIDPATRTIRCVGSWESSVGVAPSFLTASREAALSRGQGLPGRVWESGRIHWSPDVQGDPGVIRRVQAKAEGLREAVIIPLLAGEEVRGVVEFYGRGQIRVDEAMLSILASMGSQIGQFIERKRAEDALAERSSRMIRLQAGLLEMTGSVGTELSLEQVTETAARTLGSDAVGAWLFDEAGSALVCRDRFLTLQGLHEHGARMETSRIPRYVAAVESARVVMAQDAAADPRTSEWSGVSSTLDAAIRHRGRVAGVLRFEHHGASRTWTLEDQEFASSVADRVALWLLENDRRKGEEEIRRLNTSLEMRVGERTQQLQESLEEQEQFAYSVSHDLRAPLRAMSGFSQALFEDYAGSLDETGREYARRIMDATARMDALIKDLLAYSRLSRAEIQLQPVDLNPLVAGVLHQLNLERVERRAIIDVGEPLLAVKANALTLTQVILNLVSNAMKFVDDKTDPRVKIRTEERGNRVRLWIEDNGIGILPEHQDRIFRVFERLNRVERYPGTGIGLALVRKAMTRMDGSAGVESDGRKGSRFWVELEKA